MNDTKFLPCDRMTVDERLREIAALLARAIIRSRGYHAKFGLGFRADQRVHVPPSTQESRH